MKLAVGLLPYQDAPNRYSSAMPLVQAELVKYVRRRRVRWKGE